MKAIHTGSMYQIYDDGLETFDKLPPQCYVIRFSQNCGFYMEKYSDITINEEKVYGVHNEKVNKVLNTFSKVNRNLGVILSGAKGIGKSLFARMIAERSVSKGVPVIIVDTFIPGIASYIEQIDQTVMVLFDEFDKTFGSIKTGDNVADPQAGLLSLFDGVSSGKKLFVVTCNELSKLNDYLVNRPGRFHYHFRFEYPNADEIRTYLEDKLDKEYYSEIENVISFASRINLNYDCLRAIAFELNTGLTFAEAITDLNIINVSSQGYKVTLFLDDGSKGSSNEQIDTFDVTDTNHIIFRLDNGDYFNSSFDNADLAYDPARGVYFVDGSKIRGQKENYDDEPTEDQPKPLYLTLARKIDRDIHYNL